MKWKVALLIAVVAAGFAIAKLKPMLTFSAPAAPAPHEAVYVSQNWSPEQRLRFHHTPQGTRLLPYSWFIALEQPCFNPFGCAKFSDSTFLQRFGFLPSPVDPALNPDGLPVGFAMQKEFTDPLLRRDYAVLGLNCAACHTGELHYGKYAVRIEGGPALIELAQFQKAVGLALAFNKLMPFRYGRFERNVLGPDATDAKKKELHDDFDSFLAAAKAEKDTVDARKIYDNAAGFARTDALTRIGNQVFAVDMNNNDNFAVANAPVRFPQIWDSSWFTWVQYNSSIADPLVRNIGEALGVRAMATLSGATAGDYANSVHVEGLKTLEDLLGGAAPYTGLQSPKWPAVFRAIDASKAARGELLYRKNCQHCHLPPPAELVAELQTETPAHWWKNKQGKSFLVVHDLPVEFVGTDPHEAVDFMNRTADTGALNKGRVSAAEGLELVTRNIAQNYFRKSKLTPAQQIEWSGFRDPGDPVVRGKAIYKARPLNGIWAVAPYLHNGSVPNVYLLLSPQAERPDTFWLGSREYDPAKFGYSTEKISGASLYDVSQPGNSNRGHEFKDAPLGNGVIGTALSPEQRCEILEFLKTL